jgi:hypothetical protein
MSMNTSCVTRFADEARLRLSAPTRPEHARAILIKSSSTQSVDTSSSSCGPTARDQGGRCADPDRELQS